MTIHDSAGCRTSYRLCVFVSVLAVDAKVARHLSRGIRTILPFEPTPNKTKLGRFSSSLLPHLAVTKKICHYELALLFPVHPQEIATPLTRACRLVPRKRRLSLCHICECDCDGLFPALPCLLLKIRGRAVCKGLLETLFRWLSRDFRLLGECLSRNTSEAGNAGHTLVAVNSTRAKRL